MIFIDAHVHIYNCYDLDIFFDSAYANMSATASRYGRKKPFMNILMFAEGSNYHWFEKLKDIAQDKEEKIIVKGDWSIQLTDEVSSLRAKKTDKILFLIQGFQVVTSENIEILALGTEKRIEDGLSITETIQAVIAVDGIPVIPYGFGKWVGKRGRVIRGFLSSGNFERIFLGDSGNRPGFIPAPALLKQAGKTYGIRNLPGSDPLPLAMDSRRVGSFGFILDGSVSMEYPFKTLKDLLWNMGTAIRPYGILMNPFRFLLTQARIRTARLS